MRKFAWLVFTNCNSADHVEEFNRWYDDVHLPDLLRIPGIVGAKRLSLADTQIKQGPEGIVLCDPAAIGPQYPYLAIYDIEADEVGPVLNEVTNRAGGEEMEISPYLGDVHMLVYERH